MKIKLTEEQQEKLHSVGLVNVGRQVEVEKAVFEKNYAEWKKTLPLAGHSTLTLKAISTCLWTKRSGQHRKDFVLPSAQPTQEVKVQAKFPRWELRVIIGLLVLILGWLIFALPARAQFSQLVFIEWKDGGSAVTDGFFTYGFTVDCTTNLTCTSDGATLTLAASAGSGGRWDQLTAPTGAMSLVSSADAEIMTWDFQSDFSTDRFVLKQTTGNPTGGALLLVTATDADALLAQFGASNGVQITQAGALTAIGTGAITATLGDSATSFFSSGTLEDARLSSAVALSSDTLDFFSATTVAELATVLSDEDFTPGSESSAEGVLDLPDLQGQIEDAQIADAAVDGGSGGEIADNSITLDDLAARTIEISILESDAVPDSGGNVWAEPFNIAATNDNWLRMVWVFTDTGSARNCLHGGFLVPGDYDTSGTASFNVVWSSSVTSNDVEWDFDFRGIGGNDGESFDQATAVESLNANDTAPSDAWERMEIALGITESNLAAGDDVEFLLCRDMSDAGDTLVGDAYLFNLIFSYTN